ncbi:MAG: DNA polymerase II, partial [Gemmatimonadota bacterium]|nr:DNA polymerase II [Gemmatimonadota bacterium]
LYPSIIRTFNIDPLAHIEGQETASDGTGAVPGRVSDGDRKGGFLEAPNGARFSRTPGILPSMLEQFFKRREEARTTGDELASFTYKIVMNSFYGVLASASCRFAAPQLAGAITEFGHYILKWCRDELEKDGYKVLYGDTDSVFVDLDPADSSESDRATDMGRKVCDRINARLAAHVRERYGVASYLELELEKCYHRFLLPSMRGDVECGRAKGYAGLRRGTDGDRVEIVGMEAVRRDWTDLAHRLQGVLLDRVFHDVPGAEIEEEIYHWVQEVRSGRRDELLVYRKNLRKPVESYTRSVPPHVKAARLMDNPTGVIRYVITLDGPQPEGRITAPIDYGHYVEKQIRPIVTTVAHAYELDVEAALSGRLSLFGNALNTPQYESGRPEVPS